jgi:LmbE family N-acetylglucosaminyl deacetylase
MMTELPSAPRVALAVVAHPDDVEFMAGGLVSRWARQGTELHYCLLTDGNSGSRDPSLTPAALALLRRQEQQEAGAVFGVASYTFLGQPDGRLLDGVAVRLDVARVIRRVQPDAVITSDPGFFYSGWYLNHPDHRAAGAITMAAVMPLANTLLAAPELLEEDLAPHDVGEVYLTIPPRPSLYVPLDEADFERKALAMNRHVSQMGDWDATPFMRQFGEQVGAEARAAGVECAMAEAFFYVNLRRLAAA